MGRLLLADICPVSRQWGNFFFKIYFNAAIARFVETQFPGAYGFLSRGRQLCWKAAIIPTDFAGILLGEAKRFLEV